MARDVLDGTDVVERTITTTGNDAVYAMRILPYQTEEQAVAGVVLTFVDISRVNRAEDRVRGLSRDLSSRVRSLETLLELVPVGIFIAHSEENWRVLVNPYAAALLGQEDGKTGLSVPRERCNVMEASKLPPEYEALAEAGRTGKPVSDLEVAFAAQGRQHGRGDDLRDASHRRARHDPRRGCGRDRHIRAQKGRGASVDAAA